MIPSLRRQFNENFTPEKYQTFLRQIDDACGTHVQFRLCETPCFFPKQLIQRMAEDGKELIRQLVDNPEYLERSDESIPAEFDVPNQAAQTMIRKTSFSWRSILSNKRRCPTSCSRRKCWASAPLTSPRSRKKARAFITSAAARGFLSNAFTTGPSWMSWNEKT